MKIRKTASIVVLYAITVLIGGTIGYIRASSVPSLISGLCFGSLLLIASLLMFKRIWFGNVMALILSIFLEAFFMWKFIRTLHFFPSGMLSLMSLFVIILVTLKISRKVQNTR